MAERKDGVDLKPEADFQEVKMNGIDVFMNGQKLCTASLEDGTVTVQFVLRGEPDPNWLTVIGRDRKTGEHVRWARINAEVGDEFTLKIVPIESGDSP